MNLRNRSLLILGLTFFVFFLIIAAVSVSVTLSGLDRIEYQDMAESVNQTKSAINAESAALLRTTQDWAFWDDMYQFAADQNPGFLDRNTDPTALATLQLNLFMILDDKGNLLHGQALSPDFQTSGPVPADLDTLIRSHPYILKRQEDDLGISGLLFTPEGLMVIAAVPILSSERTGPVRGTLVMGRYMDSGPLQRINEITGYSITLNISGKEGTSLDIPDIQERPAGEQNLVLVRENESILTGYSALQDLAGRDLALGISMDRQLYRIGLSNIFTYLVLLAIWAVITGLIVVYVMDRTVLQRMSRLTDHVRSLSGDRVANPAPVLTGNDELVGLERTIFSVRDNLLMREQQLRAFVNAMPGAAALFSLDGTILLANPAFSVYLKKSPEELTGMPIHSLLPPADIEKYDRFVQEAIRKKAVVHFENETGGKTFLMSYYPVLGNDGEAIQLGFLTFDISERKRLENALQKATKKISLLNTVIFSDIQNKVFVQMGYLELARQMATEPRVKDYLEKEEVIVGEIQSSLQFARQYNDLGNNPPRWQNVLEVMLFAISHIELGTITRDFRVEGLEIYADALLERVFVTLVENTIIHAEEATIIRAGYTLTDDDAVIFMEDDGPGIPEDKKEEIFRKGIGAGGSASLFLSREILSITGITIRENGVVGTGARFEIRIPRGSYRFAGK